MPHSAFRLLAIASLLACAWQLDAARRPRYGGVLRVELRAERALDPAEWPMVFETLVAIDDAGRVRPALATSWRRDSSAKRWQFRLRPNVAIHNGGALSASLAASALEANGCSASAAGDDVVVLCETPVPLAAFAEARRAVYVRGAGGALLGTGPFRIADWAPGRATLAANDDYWAGRPFLDQIVVQTGHNTKQQLFDLEAGKTDLIELGPDDVRNASKAGARIWTSAPVSLLALVFEPGRPASEDAGVREAIARSIDRPAILNVILQKQGEVAGGLLPRWLSGYSMLFSTARDAARSRQLAPNGSALTLAYEPSDALARMVADRVAVNAREAGIRLTQPPAGAQPDVRLVRLRIAPPIPEIAFGRLAAALRLPNPARQPAAVPLETLYAAERAVVEEFRVVPLFHLPEIFGSSPALKTWSGAGLLRTGEWRWDDLWLDSGPP